MNAIPFIFTFARLGLLNLDHQLYATVPSISLPAWSHSGMLAGLTWLVVRISNNKAKQGTLTSSPRDALEHHPVSYGVLDRPLAYHVWDLQKSVSTKASIYQTRRIPRTSVLKRCHGCSVKTVPDSYRQNSGLLIVGSSQGVSKTVNKEGRLCSVALMSSLPKSKVNKITPTPHTSTGSAW